MFPEQHRDRHEATDEAFPRAARFGSATSPCFRRLAGVSRVATGVPLGPEAPHCSLSARTSAGPMAEVVPSGDAGETRDRSTAPANDAGDGEGEAASAARNSALDAQRVEHGAESGNDGTVAKKKKASLDENIKDLKEMAFAYRETAWRPLTDPMRRDYMEKWQKKTKKHSTS